MVDIIYKEESYKIIGARFEVYKTRGCGFTEPVYQECLQLELSIQGIPFVAQPVLELEYKGQVLSQTFKPDFICYGKIVVELKALDRLADVHRAQTLNYLNATGYDLALLVNFGHFPNSSMKGSQTIKIAEQNGPFIRGLPTEWRSTLNNSLFSVFSRISRAKNSYA